MSDHGLLSKVRFTRLNIKMNNPSFRDDVNASPDALWYGIIYAFDLWEDIYKSKGPPNFLPSSEGEEWGNRALKVNFVCLHGSINVATHVLEGFLICPFWYASSGHGCFALNLYLSSSHHLNFLSARPSRKGGSSFNGPGWWCGPAQLCTSSYDELQVETFNWWSSSWLHP